MIDLTGISAAELTSSARAIEEIGHRASSMEECATEIVRYLYPLFGDGTGAGPACVLVRFFKTHDFAELPGDLQDAASGALAGTVVSPGMKCLVLLGTAGMLPEWNDRKRSATHRAIPLPSRRVVDRMPMISQLVKQLGLDVADVVRPDANLIVGLEERATGVFYIKDAAENPYIPAQQQFVIPYGVRSVIGVGGMLPSGNLFAVVMFTRIQIAREKAELFRALAVGIKTAVLGQEDGALLASAR